MFKFINRAKNQKGFTLVELMVVVVIIGVLVAIAIPIYNNVTDRAETGACQANLRILDGAIMMHFAETGDYTNDTDWETDLGGYVDGQDVFDCPGDGEYSFNDADTPTVRCSETDHNYRSGS